MENQHEQPSELEPTAAFSDFKSALVILVLAIALLVHTLSFPMSGSYGGVENQWFVSPALFPLLVCGCLVLCSAILLFKAIRQQGYQRFFALSTWLGDWQQRRVRDRWYVIFQLLIFVYGLVPSIDFYIAAVLLLAALTCRFYYPLRSILVLLPLLQAVLLALLVLFKLNFDSSGESINVLTVNQDPVVINYSDIAAGVMVLMLVIYSCVAAEQESVSRCATMWAVVMLVPMVLVLIFSFLLYVPMPVEYGTVSNFLSYLVYDVLAWQ